MPQDNQCVWQRHTFREMVCLVHQQVDLSGCGLRKVSSLEILTQKHLAEQIKTARKPQRSKNGAAKRPSADIAMRLSTQQKETHGTDSATGKRA